MIQLLMSSMLQKFCRWSKWAFLLVTITAGVRFSHGQETPPGFDKVPSVVSTYDEKLVRIFVPTSGSWPMTYEWRRNGVPIPGVTYSEVIFTATAAQDGDTLQLFLSNPYGATNTPPIILMVSTGVDIKSQPVSIARVAGSKAAFRVVADGAPPIRYRWFKNNSLIAAATNDTLWLNDVNSSEVASYHAEVSNSSQTTNSAPADLELAPGTRPPATTSYSRLVMGDDPVGYWRLDEGDGATIAFDSAGSFNGEYVPSVGSFQFPEGGIPGETNRAVRLTRNASVMINHALEISPVTTPWSVDFWVQPEVFSTNAMSVMYAVASSIWEVKPPSPNPNTFYLHGALYGWIVYINSAGTWDFQLMTGGSIFGYFAQVNAPKVVVGAWHHLTLTDDLESIRFYVNGKKCAVISRAGSGFIPNGINNGLGGPIILGRTDHTRYVNDYGFNWLEGAVDDLAVYNYALSPGQIEAHFKNSAFLKVERDGGNLTLKWANGILQESETANENFVDNLEAISPHQVSLQDGRFYRVRVR
jgi:hypothetical protein